MPINMAIEEKRILGRLAFANGFSLGEYLRRMICRGLAAENAEAALRIQRIRISHRRHRCNL